MTYTKKWKKGKRIASLDEISEEKMIFIRDKVYHCGWFQSMQFRVLKDYMDNGWLFKAVRREGG